jgi:Ribbon-helix-helix domain
MPKNYRFAEHFTTCYFCVLLVYYTSENDVWQGSGTVPLIRTNVYLDERQLERLRAKSQADNIPVSELVRRAIDAYLAWDDPTYRPRDQRSHKRDEDTGAP